MTESEWKVMAIRLVIELYPCARCTFALATYGEHDLLFDINYPRLCKQCVELEPHPEDYKIVLLTTYRPLVRDVVREYLKER